MASNTDVVIIKILGGEDIKTIENAVSGPLRVMLDKGRHTVINLAHPHANVLPLPHGPQCTSLLTHVEGLVGRGENEYVILYLSMKMLLFFNAGFALDLYAQSLKIIDTLLMKRHRRQVAVLLPPIAARGYADGMRDAQLRILATLRDYDVLCLPMKAAVPWSPRHRSVFWGRSDILAPHGRLYLAGLVAQAVSILEGNQQLRLTGRPYNTCVIVAQGSAFLYTHNKLWGCGVSHKVVHVCNISKTQSCLL